MNTPSRATSSMTIAMITSIIVKPDSVRTDSLTGEFSSRLDSIPVLVPIGGHYLHWPSLPVVCGKTHVHAGGLPHGACVAHAGAGVGVAVGDVDGDVVGL